MKEKDFQRQFSHWLKAVHKQTGCFELKLAKTNSLPYSSVATHQIEGLLNAKHGTLVYKLPDVGYQTPWDCICLSGVPAYVVVKFPSGVVYGIDIDDFIRQRDASTRKSLTEDEASVIPTFVIL